MPRRILALAFALVAAVLFTGALSAADKPKKAKNNQMVKGTIKSVDTAKQVLVVSQKVKNESVDRELSIVADTEVEVTVGGETKAASGKEGLFLLEGKEGSAVQVKCDKDVKVLKVTVKAKK